MKKITLILAMLVVAATTFSQTSRRTASDTNPAREQETRRTVNSGRTTTSSEQTKSTNSSATRRSSDVERSGGNATRSETIQRSSDQRPSTTTRRTTEAKNDNQDNEIRKSTNNVNTNTQRRTEVSSNNDTQRRTNEVSRQNNGTRYSNEGRRPNTAVRVSANRTHYESPRQYREYHTVVHHYTRPPRPVHYRAKHYPYRHPAHIEIYWTPAMRTEYIEIYPMVRTWRYPVGYRIETISAYNAYAYAGDVMNVYGKVEEVFYSHNTDEYILYFGAYYPYHDFSVVVPGHIARNFSRWPERYFEQNYITVTGLITVYDERPEIVVMRTRQINPY